MDDSDIRAQLEGRRFTRGDMLRRSILGGIGMASIGPLMALMAETDITDAWASELAKGKSLKSLIAAAKKEGALNTIALPPDWADYGEIISKFQSKYGVSITNSSPDDSSAQEIQALVSLKGQSKAPDVVDVSPTFAKAGKDQGLFKAYKVAKWNTVPAGMKDSKGLWTGDYYGIQSFGTNLNVAKVAPKEWNDLLNPRYKGMVALDGDPRNAGDAFSAVFAASLANGGSLNNIEPGINFFAKMKKAGTFNPARALTADIAKGATPIAIKWDYLNLALVDEFKGNPKYKVTVPHHGVYGGYYAQALSAGAPHPNAGKLWLEFIYSDIGQLLFLKGYTHPARYNDLAKHHKIPHNLAKKLPPASAYKKVKFASLDQITKAGAVLQAQWGPKVIGH